MKTSSRRHKKVNHKSYHHDIRAGNVMHTMIDSEKLGKEDLPEEAGFSLARSEGPKIWGNRIVTIILLALISWVVVAGAVFALFSVM